MRAHVCMCVVSSTETDTSEYIFTLYSPALPRSRHSCAANPPCDYCNPMWSGSVSIIVTTGYTGHVATICYKENVRHYLYMYRCNLSILVPPSTKNGTALQLCDTKHIGGEYGRHFADDIWNAFSWMKMFEFRLKFQWSFFPRIQWTINQYSFR